MPSRTWQMRTSCFRSEILALWGVNEIRIAHLNHIDPALLLQNPTLRFAFIPVNLLVLTAASLLAYLRHDAIEGYEDAQGKREKCLRARGKCERRASDRKFLHFGA